MPVIPFGPSARDDRAAAQALPSLPDTHTAPWMTSRKLQILTALDAGLLTLAEACQRYNLTREEIAEWRRHFEQHGEPGLKVTKLQAHRRHQRQLPASDVSRDENAS